MNKVNNISKWLFLIGLFVFCIGICCINCTPDNDLWARLLVGEHFFENFNILKQDFLSYTPTHNWYDHEWGASIFFYGALKFFGHNGLILLKGILLAITMFFCYKTVELSNTKNTVSYNILYYLLMAWCIQKSLGPTVRCLMFTCLFFSVFLYILERAKNDKNKTLILLPILMIFWSNIHGGCLSGIGLIGLYIVGEFLNGKDVKKYIYTLIPTLLVLFINPYGFEYVKFLFFAGLMDRNLITEWFGSFSKEYITDYMRYKFYLVFGLLTGIIYIIKNKINYPKLDKTKFLIILTLTYLSVTHIRHQSFFILATGTLLYQEFYSLLNNFTTFLKEKLNIKNEESIKHFVVLKQIIVYVLITVLLLPLIIQKNKTIRITETKYPRYAIEFIKINKLNGNLLINFGFGSYAAYKLYPNNLIFMDGRYEEVYNPELLIELQNFHMLKGDWEKVLKAYPKPDVMVLESKYPVYNKILNSSDWKLVFYNQIGDEKENYNYGVFVPTELVKTKYLYPTPDIDYYNKTLFDKIIN